MIIDKTGIGLSSKRYTFFALTVILMLSGSMYLLSSCEQDEDVPGNGNAILVSATGEQVTVNFTAGERDFGNYDVVVRSTVSLPPEWGIIPISRELEGGVYLSATLQESSPAVRLRTAASLAVGRKVRVVAYDIDTIKIAHADYEVEAGGQLVPHGTPPMTVPSGSVMFVAYSFNDTIAMPAFADTIVAIGSRDLLWGDTTVTVGPGNTNVHIILDHLFSKIKLEASTVLSTTSTIHAIYGARYTHTFPVLTVRNGDLTPGDTSQILFDWQAAGTAPIWPSKDHFIFTNGDPPVVIIDSALLDGTVYKDVAPPWRVEYATPLEVGKEYTLYVRFTPPCTALTNVSLSSVPVSGSTMLTGETIYLTAAPVPSGATDVQYEWQYHDGITWVTMSITTAPTCNATVIAGLNQFRVVASNSCSSATSVLPITVTGFTPAGGSAARITWDDEHEQYVLTTDPRDAGLYFRYGSVVGLFSGTGRHTQDLSLGTNTSVFNVANHVTINVSTVTITGVSDVPYVNTHTHIDAAYHTATNVKAGRGDPCRLVGLDLNNIRNKSAGQLTATEIDNFTWRLPTGPEHQQFSGYTTIQSVTPPGIWWWSLNQNPSNFTLGIPGGEFPERNHPNGGAGKFLPAVGQRNNDGTTSMQQTRGFFLTNTSTNTGDYRGFVFRNNLLQLTNAMKNYFWPVRCVPQVMPTLSATPDTLAFAATPLAGQNVLVTTNQPGWTASSDQSWCTVTPSGVNGGTLAVTCQPNTGAQRNATITVNAGVGLNVTVAVTQDAPPEPDYFVIDHTYVNAGVSSETEIHLHVITHNQPYGNHWFAYANVPDSHISTDTPPAGTQVSPPRANSCASLYSINPLNPWRMATYYEMWAIRDYVTANGGLAMYNFDSSNGYGFYWSATASTNPSFAGGTHAYGLQITTQGTTESPKGYGLGGGYYVRCVRYKM